MTTPACHALRAIPRQARPSACRHLARRRLPQIVSRKFHNSALRRREDEPPQSNPNPDPSALWSNTIDTSQATLPISIERQSPPEGPDEPPERPIKPRDQAHYGSASRRAGRNVKRIKELPQVFVPAWFFERNAVTLEDSQRSVRTQDEIPVPSAPVEVSIETSGNVPQREEELAAVKDRTAAGELKTGAGEHIDHDSYLAKSLDVPEPVLAEVAAVISAGLNIPESHFVDNVASIRPHVLLACLKDGASAYLEVLARNMALERQADFMRLSAQDIAELGGDYIDEASEFKLNSLSTLAYDAAQVIRNRPSQSTDDQVDQEDFDEMADEEDESETTSSRAAATIPGIGKMNIVPTFIGAAGSLQDIFKAFRPEGTGGDEEGSSSKTKGIIHVKDSTPETKLGLLVETMLNVPELKRIRVGPRVDHKVEGVKTLEQTEEPLPEERSTSFRTLQRGSRSLIILVEDYQLIRMTPQGHKFLDKLHEVVDSRRREGQAVLIIGTRSDDKYPAPEAKSSLDAFQSQTWHPLRSIVMPVTENVEGLMAAEQKRKIRDVNLRHLRDMLRRIASSQEQVGPIIYDWDLSIDSKWAFVSGMEQSVWTLENVNRIATIALGLLGKGELMHPETLERAIETLDHSDEQKMQWSKNEKTSPKKQGGKNGADRNTEDIDNEARMQKLRKKCNSHEKKLLNGVVDAKDIKTTFADVQAPPETIEALKTLTSLSLVRPDAFTYGVLASDRIPGLLLYGPPGTGKTLLAKAVAKESGATVLEVSGSDVYDMYVGEGEKNVRAIFTLAKKLSPCIVFIDEADAILGARSSGQSRTSHRELINQFLREWDGVTDMNAFIMVATNRPFDLDEASLRRLPRRLLIDLPVETDRHAILKIHLRNEILSPEVSIASLAAQTPFYSGSDLKNLCVAAALACVREEFDAATKHNIDAASENPYQYAEKRTLSQRHFDKAMDEISASISEDMGSLSAIRKFDEKYGDRKGRRKKLGGYGFKTVEDGEKAGSDAARVRNQS